MKTHIGLLFTVLLLVIHNHATAQQDSTIDDIGDIAFVAYSYGSQDGYAFVLLDDCPNGTVIKFIDEEWTGSSFYSTNGEGENTWTNNTGSYLSKGTVIVVENANHNPSVNIGSITESNAGFDIASSSPDQIFAIIGSRASPTFLAMAGYTTLPNNGTGAVQTLSGTGLVEDSTGMYLSTEKMYTGSNTCGSLCSCHTMIHDNANWQTISTSLQFPKDVYASFGGTALPVLLTSFKLTKRVDSVQLHWTTAQEINNKGFFVQCKTERGLWTSLAFVKGLGTNASKHTYSYSFKRKIQASTYYRLKQVDYNGAYAFSDILRLEEEPAPKKDVYWYQTEEGIVFDATESSIHSIQLYNHLGKIIYQVKPQTQPIHISADYFNCSWYYALLATDAGIDWIRIVLNPF